MLAGYGEGACQQAHGWNQRRNFENLFFVIDIIMKISLSKY